MFINMKKVILITGCSSGIGRAAAEHLSKLGHTVIPTVRKESDLKLFPNSVLLDLSWSEDQIQKVLQKVIKKYPDINVLVNNAGFGMLGKISEISTDQLRQQFDTNLFGLHSVTRSLLPTLRQNKGTIINISSILGLFTIPEYGIYSASKYALESYSQALRLEEKDKGVNVVVVNPGAIETSFYKNSKGSEFFADPKAAKPILLANLIEKIIHTSNPKTNYIIGKESGLVKLILPLPTALREKIISLMP